MLSPPVQNFGYLYHSSTGNPTLSFQVEEYYQSTNKNTPLKKRELTGKVNTKRISSNHIVTIQIQPWELTYNITPVMVFKKDCCI